MQTNSCPICQTRLREKEQSAYGTCPACKVMIRQAENPGQAIDKIYENSWQNPGKFTAETGGTDLRLARIYCANLLSELNLKDFSGLKLLDFGAGKGEMLIALREKGAEVYGVEPYGSEYLKSQGFTVFSSLAEAKTQAPYDGWVSLDVIEHLEAPWADAAGLRTLLKPGGWGFLSTANNRSLRAILAGENWEEALKTVHLFLFSPESLEKLIQNAGFQKYIRINWTIKYSDSLPKRITNLFLTLLKLDGELRYLIYK